MLIMLVVVGGLWFYRNLSNHWTQPNSSDPTLVELTIRPGTPFNTIVETLHNNELIQSPFAFKVFGKRNNLVSKVQAGDYSLPRDATYAELFEALQDGQSAQIKVTIPEGYTIAQIDQVLTNKGLIEAGDFETCTKDADVCDFSEHPIGDVLFLEGYLYPDTYYVSGRNFSSYNFVTQLYNTTKNRLDPYAEAIESSGRSLSDIIIMASLIEREAANEAEMPVIAGVLWKRLDERIHLGVDATTRYELNAWKRPLYTEDFIQPTPYNTRKNYGLPPTGIGAPGMSALVAAIQPEASEWYYYLHDLTGQIHYGRTLEEHNANKRKYL